MYYELHQIYSMRTLNKYLIMPLLCKSVLFKQE